MPNEWIGIKNRLPPEGETVETKIDDGKGERNIQPLKRRGRLWYFPDDSMYAYYCPTHWRAPEPAESPALVEPTPAIVKTLTNQHGQPFTVYLSDGKKIGIQRDGNAAWLRIEDTPIVHTAAESLPVEPTPAMLDAREACREAEGKK